MVQVSFTNKNKRISPLFLDLNFHIFHCRGFLALVSRPLCLCVARSLSVMMVINSKIVDPFVVRICELCWKQTMLQFIDRQNVNEIITDVISN